MSIDQWMDEVVVLMCNEILLSHKKEFIWFSCSEVDDSRACYTKWSESEKQLSFINAYIWSLEKWYWWTYSQGWNRDRENGLVDTGGEGEGGANWESSIDVYSLACVK